jgi:hypothetical protein
LEAKVGGGLLIGHKGDKVALLKHLVALGAVGAGRGRVLGGDGDLVHLEVGDVLERDLEGVCTVVVIQAVAGRVEHLICGRGSIKDLAKGVRGAYADLAEFRVV